MLELQEANKIANTRKEEALPAPTRAEEINKAFLSNPLVLAIGILVGVNFLLLLWQPCAKVDPLLLPATHTWTWWATQEYVHLKQTPTVALLGSSLFMHPISRQDADFLNQDLDYVQHHRSLYLEHQLRKRFGDKVHPICFNFGLPGDMVSDDYMVTRCLLQGKHKPQYLVLGLSLRDFIDNAVNCPGTTPPFRYLKRFTNIEDIVDIAMPILTQQFDYRFGQVFYLWGKRLDLQVWLNDLAKTIVGPIMLRISQPSLLNELDYRKHVPSNLHSEVEEGMAIVRTHIPYHYIADYADYYRRCGKFKDNMFKIQMTFLQKLIKLCAARKIQLIILNMPLTKDNLSIMPSGAYERYLRALENETKYDGISFIDYNHSSYFLQTDFYDTAHMNSSGGKKLLDALANLQAIKL